MKYDLSIIIPAKSEEWLAQTIKDIVKNKTDKTEVIAVLDGEWTHPPIEDHPDVRIIKLGKNVGQRGATKIGARLSKAKWIAKCDAHCAFDKHFDKKLLETPGLQDNWTIVPVMRNLHVFNWRCMDCGDETYQGPTPEGCKNCNVNTPDRFEKKLIWYPKPSPNSSAFKFTPNRLQFKYFGSLKDKQQKSGERIVETMSLQGSFFMLSRERYFTLDIDDESFGGWGQQGTTVAIKTWLSGGRVVCNLDTWYGHMFRTQGGFAFPWGNPAKQQQQARKVSYELFAKNQWDKQVRPLSWLVERFWTELQQEPHKEDDPKWTQADLDKLKQTEGRFSQKSGLASGVSKGILYFSDNQLPMKYAWPVRKRIRKIAQDKGMELVSSTLKPTKLGKNIVVDGKRSYLTMFSQILAGLETMESEIVFMAEHDCLYPPEHFDFTPKDKNTFYYDVNWYKVHLDDKSVVKWQADQVSGLCAYRDLLIKHYKERIASFDKDNFDRKFEPGSGIQSEQWESPVPYIDIRHTKNLTFNKRDISHFRDKTTAVNFQTMKIEDIPDWDLSDILK